MHSLSNTVQPLAEHMKNLHKVEKEIIKCKHCELGFESKPEIKNHMKEAHKSYKLCRNFPHNRCEYDTECSFRHIILEQGKHICYRCGKISNSKTEMMKHVKETHGNIICKKFLQNECNFGSRCLFKHTSGIAQNVENNTVQGRAQTQDFQNTLTMRPVVGTQGRSHLQQMSTEDQQLIQTLNSQMIFMMNQMNQIQTMLGQMNPNQI